MLARTRQARRSCATRSRTGRSSCSRRRLSRGERRRRTRQRAHQGALRPRAGAPRRAGCSPTTPASRWRRSTAARACTPPAGPRAATSRRLLERARRRRGPRAPATSRSSCALARAARGASAPACSKAGSRASRGAKGGFGFDPVFVPVGETKTVARARRSLEGEHSHRGKAAQALRDALSVSSLYSCRVARQGAVAAPPVHLGAEHDHVRHHVEPDEQQRLPDSARSTGLCPETRRTPAAPGRSPRAGPPPPPRPAAPRASVRSAFVST